MVIEVTTGANDRIASVVDSTGKEHELYENGFATISVVYATVVLCQYLEWPEWAINALIRQHLVYGDQLSWPLYLWRKYTYSPEQIEEAKKFAQGYSPSFSVYDNV